MDEPTEALWGLTVDVSDDEEAKARQEKKERREKRMRAAFEEARKTYKAKLDTNAWFLEHVSMDEHTPVSEFDAKASQRLQSSILYMYMKKEFSQAYEWAYSYLCKVHVLGSDVILGEHNLPVFAAPPVSTKQEKSLANSAMTKEVLDIALRCILHAPMTDGVDRCLAAAFERVRLPSKDYLALFVDNEVVESAVKQCNVRASTHLTTVDVSAWTCHVVRRRMPTLKPPSVGVGGVCTCHGGTRAKLASMCGSSPVLSMLGKRRTRDRPSGMQALCTGSSGLCLVDLYVYAAHSLGARYEKWIHSRYMYAYIFGKLFDGYGGAMGALPFHDQSRSCDCHLLSTTQKGRRLLSGYQVSSLLGNHLPVLARYLYALVCAGRRYNDRGGAAQCTHFVVGGGSDHKKTA